MKYIDKLDISKKNTGFIEQAKAEVEDYFDNFSDSPDRISRWAHHYFCDVEGSRLTYNDKTPHSHICSTCGKEHSNELLDGCWITMYRNQGATNAWKSAFIYKVTGDTKYLKYLTDYVSFYNDNYLKFVRHNKEGIDFQNGQDVLWGVSRIMPQNLNEAIFIVRIINALEIVKDELSEDFIKNLEKVMFTEAFEMFKPQVDKIHNIPTWMNSCIGVMGHFLNNSEMLDFTYNGEFSINEQLLKGVTEDYFWYEGSIHYNYFLLEGVVNHLLFAELYDYDFKVGKEVVEKMLIAGYEYAFDSHLLPNPNDGWPDVNLKTYSYIYAVATKVYGEDSKIGKILGSILNKDCERGILPLSKPYYYKNEISLEELLFTPAVRANNSEIIKCDTINFKSSYCGLIKNEDSNIFLKYGHNGPSHAHPDKMNIEVLLGGVMVSRDLSNSGYGNPLCNEWQRKSPSHNTITVNGESHTSFDGGKTLIETETRLKAVAENVYDGVTFTRDVELTETGFKDEFTVEAQRNSVFDYFFHVEGETVSNMTLEDCNLGYNDNGYQHLHSMKKIVTDGDSYTITWKVEDKTVKSLIDIKDCELFIGESPDNSESGFRKTIILRKESKETTFRIDWELV